MNQYSAMRLLSDIVELNACVGNPKPKFISLGEAQKVDHSYPRRICSVDSAACVAIGEQQYAWTI